MVNNQKGSSLIVVLLVMTVFTIVGLGILGLNVNTSKQVNKTGGDLQATNLAEMGVTHLQEAIFQILSVSNQIKPSLVKTELETKLPSQLKLNHPYQMKSGTYYQIEQAVVTTVPETDINNQMIEQVNVSYTSTGYSTNNQIQRITGEIEATVSNINAFPGYNPTATVYIDEHQDYTHKDIDMLVNKDYYFEDGFSYKGTNDNAILSFQQGIISLDTVTTDNSGTYITINNDAHVYSIQLHHDDGKHALMCIKGDLYVYGPEPIPYPKENSTSEPLNCANEITKGTSGIIVENYYHRPLGASWNRNQFIINAEY